MLINLTVVGISLYICISKYHAIYLKFIPFLLKNKTKRVPVPDTLYELRKGP